MPYILNKKKFQAVVFYGVRYAGTINSLILLNLLRKTYSKSGDFLRNLVYSLTESLMKHRLHNTKLPKIL